MKKIIFLLLTLGLSFNIFGGANRVIVINYSFDEESVESSKIFIEKFSEKLKENKITQIDKQSFINKVNEIKKEMVKSENYVDIIKLSQEFNRYTTLNFKFHNNIFDVEITNLFSPNNVETVKNIYPDYVDNAFNTIFKNVLRDFYKDKPKWVSDNKNEIYKDVNGEEIVKVVGKARAIGDFAMTCGEAEMDGFKKIRNLIGDDLEVDIRVEKDGDSVGVTSKLQLIDYRVTDSWISIQHDCYVLLEIPAKNIKRVMK